MRLPVEQTADAAGVGHHGHDVSAAHREAAIARQAQLTKPTGSLGRLEQL
ncbi:MAG: nicotinate-nucleotide--dimethylbenzimidazole phosphoribosyltransferase, partial [Bradyrhizobium sp.]